jgi:hypothetical protein
LVIVMLPVHVPAGSVTTWLAVAELISLAYKLRSQGAANAGAAPKSNAATTPIVASRRIGCAQPTA